MKNNFLMGTIVNNNNAKNKITGELRAFKILKKDEFINEVAKINSCEDRIDMYCFPNAPSFVSKFDFGLKFRNVIIKDGSLDSKKIELKIKSPTKVNEKITGENWIKEVRYNADKGKLFSQSKNINNDTDTTIEILSNQYNINFKEISVGIINAIKKIVNSSDSKNNYSEIIQKSLSEEKFLFSLVFKKRYILNVEEVFFSTISFEYEKGKVLNQKSNYFFSICEEHTNNDSTDFYNLMKSKNFPDNLVFGYPELLLKEIEGTLNKI